MFGIYVDIYNGHHVYLYLIACFTASKVERISIERDVKVYRPS